MFTPRTLTPEEDQRIDNAFTYHPPKGDQAERYELLRSAGRSFAALILGYTPRSREQALALTKLEEAIMWSNAAISRSE